jgi:hypothetical protein
MYKYPEKPHLPLDDMFHADALDDVLDEIFLDDKELKADFQAAFGISYYSYKQKKKGQSGLLLRILDILYINHHTRGGKSKIPEEAFESMLCLSMCAVSEFRELIGVSGLPIPEL